MISNDEYENTIIQFLNWYKQFKTIFTNFQNSINTDLAVKNQFNISIQEEKEKSITLEFIDRHFIVEFSIFKKDERSFLGKITFSEVLQNTDDEKVKIDEAYFDRQGNLKETPSAKFSEFNLTQTDSSIYLLKYWLIKFIENYIEKEEPA